MMHGVTLNVCVLTACLWCAAHDLISIRLIRYIVCFPRVTQVDRQSRTLVTKTRRTYTVSNKMAEQHRPDVIYAVAWLPCALLRNVLWICWLVGATYRLVWTMLNCFRWNTLKLLLCHILALPVVVWEDTVSSCVSTGGWLIVIASIAQSTCLWQYVYHGSMSLSLHVYVTSKHVWCFLFLPISSIATLQSCLKYA